MARI
ncbi:hypothetical protein TIFTF001_054966 [Ficus carica]|jgi:hypothetical protein